MPFCFVGLELQNWGVGELIGLTAGEEVVSGNMDLVGELRTPRESWDG